MKPVVRFAPSPTGYLHIGGARTAIFNWLFARKHGGKFILRIEDTDAERSSRDSIEGILDGLTWLGLQWDEGPNFQSRFAADHADAARKLIAGGHAYKCFCSKEEEEDKRKVAREKKTTYRYDGTCRNLTPQQVQAKESQGLPCAVRLKVPDSPGAMTFQDRVFGTIHKSYCDIEDFVLVRANGQPLYILANAVDDIRDGITHIIRGQDGLANTPKQILIYQGLGIEPPVFAHMPLTLDPRKTKISKRRHGTHVSIQYYKEQGIVPWAMVNFLVLLGWGVPESKEYFSREELIQTFSLEGIGRTNSMFNIHPEDPKFFTDPKLLNINAHYLRTMPLEELIPHVQTRLETDGLWDSRFGNEQKKWFAETVDLVRERFHVLNDFTEKAKAFFGDNYLIEEKALQQNILSDPAATEWLPELADRIDELSPCDAANLEKMLRGFLADHRLKPGKLINAVRTAVTGQSVGPEFIQVLLCIGQKRVTERLRRIEKQ